MNTELENDLICNTGTDIANMKLEIKRLSDMIEGLETYSQNIMLIKSLKNLKQRQSNILESLEKNFDAYVEFHEPKI